jgi:membrane protease YdiL (CAAX protease family)
MRFAANYVVGKVTLGPPQAPGLFSAVILSLGAGFYEEVAFRVGLFAFGFKALELLFPMTPWQKGAGKIAWAVVTALLFSLWHYVGPLSDPLDVRSFVFRWTCGLVFTAIFVFRGFAPAVWTHALYDIWVMT